MDVQEANELVQLWRRDLHVEGKPQSVASLWAGMGTIVAITACSKDGGERLALVAKRIVCANPQSLGDRRKAASYDVECYYYERFTADLRAAAGFAISPEGLAVRREDGRRTILMSTLPQTCLSSIRIGFEAEAALRSVAALHAFFFGDKADAAVAAGLAAQGTYWYLDTRLEELSGVGNTTIEMRFKRAARAIDERLKRDSAQTCVHGGARVHSIRLLRWRRIFRVTHESAESCAKADLKACNMCLGAEDAGWVAFCDFQYIGKACCAKDLAYLLVCGRDPLDLSAMARTSVSVTTRLRGERSGTNRHDPT